MQRGQQPQRHARKQVSSTALHHAPLAADTQTAPAHASSLPSAAQAEHSYDSLPVTPDTPPPLLLTPAEAAQALRINRSTLYPLLMSGEIPSICIGRARRIPREGLRRWIEQQVDTQRVQGDGSA